jgi:methionyl-tRNA formyltransferase
MLSFSKIKNIIVMSQNSYGDQIIDCLKRHSPGTSFLKIIELAELNLIQKKYLKDSRLISFSSKNILSEDFLRRLGHGAYNIHPGPPTYPGWAPFSFALYNREKSYGVTLHEMTKEVDAGLIVDVIQFPIDSDMVQAHLENLALGGSMQMIEKWAYELVREPALRTAHLTWNPKRNTQSDFKKMCIIDIKMTKVEFHRRLKAFGNGDGRYYLHIDQDGRIYQLNLFDVKDPKQTIVIHGVPFELLNSIE